uniref:Glycosyl transferase family 1 domain-containing protein n=1 Tax=viral metagenome TaxID=1070528 RepID=A0A6C0JM60_9ZZZZ
MTDTNTNNNIRLHIPAIPYTITRDEYSHDAFTGKVKRFAPMMRSRGFEVFHYGIETSESGANKDIQLMTKDEWEKIRIESLIFLEPALSYEEAVKKNNDNTVILNHHSNWSSPLSIKFNELLRSKLKENYRSNQTDIVCIPLSRMYENSIKDCNYTIIEFGIGYSGSYLNYRIFESHAWLSHDLGMEKQSPNNYWFVVPHSFNTNEYKLSLKPNPKRIGFLGRLENFKGCHIIVEIAKKFPNIEFILCGAGNPTPYITNTTPNLIYKPPIHGKERSEYLGSCTAILCPTIYLEPFGCAAVEAQLCGTPVICADVGGMVETVEQFKTGIRCHTLADYCYGIQHALDGKFNRTYIRERAVNLYDMYKLAYNYEYIFKSVLDVSIPDKRGWYSNDSHIKIAHLLKADHSDKASVDKASVGRVTAEVQFIDLTVTSLPVTNLPVTSLPVTSLPVTSLPVTSLPVTSLPVTNNKENNKFCILLVGQMRTYDSSFIKNSYLHYLSKYESIDLYIYTWKKRGSSNRHNDKDTNDKENDIMNETKIINYYSKFPFFNVKQVIIDDFDIFYENLDSEMRDIYITPFTQHTSVTVSVPICYKYQQAVEHLKQFNINYSYCMLLRPDFEFISDVPLFNQLEDNIIYYKHWHLGCIDHGWFGTSNTIIKQLINIYTNIKKNIVNTNHNAKDKHYCNNDYILITTEKNNLQHRFINGTMNKQVCYDRGLLIDDHKIIDNYTYFSNTKSVETIINNKDITFKKIIPEKMPFSWVGYTIKKGKHNLSFNIKSSEDIDFSFIKSHSPVQFHKTPFIKKNCEELVSTEINVDNDTIIIFIFDDYPNCINITFKNITFKKI